MFRVTQAFRPSAVTITGGLAMAAGSLIYLNDSIPKARNWHTGLWPALALMAFGAVIALLGTVFVDRPDPTSRPGSCTPLRSRGAEPRRLPRGS